MLPKKYLVVQHFILIKCKNYVQQIGYAVFVKYKWINGQMHEYVCNIFLYFIIPFLEDTALYILKHDVNKSSRTNY